MENPDIQPLVQAEETTEPTAKKAKLEDSDDFPVHSTPPVHEMVGGSSVRQYLNKHLTAHLLEGLRKISKEQPENPLKELGEYLIKVSSEESNVQRNSEESNVQSEK